MTVITEAQAVVLDLILRMEKEELPISYKELAKLLGYKTISCVQRHVEPLRKKNIITKGWKVVDIGRLSSIMVAEKVKTPFITFVSRGE